MAKHNRLQYVHLLSLNVQGIRAQSKRLRLKEYIKQQNAQIILIQETHFTSEIEDSIKQDFQNFNLYHSFGSNVSKGCSILIAHSLNCEIIDFHKDKNGRYLLLNIEFDTNVYSILNIYAPNDQRLRNTFFKDIDLLLKDKSMGIKLVAGDFNETLTKIDRVEKKRNDSKIYKPSNNLSNVIKYHKLTDIWRIFNSQKTQYTWKRKNNIEKSRIDYWLIEDTIRPAILSTDIRPAQIKYTDHLAISLKIIN